MSLAADAILSTTALVGSVGGLGVLSSTFATTSGGGAISPWSHIADIRVKQKDGSITKLNNHPYTDMSISRVKTKSTANRIAPSARAQQEFVCDDTEISPAVH